MKDSDRFVELRAMSYEEYLQTPEWEAKRSSALERARHRCQVCNSPNFLQVHHRTYENLGDEKPGDLTVLCEDCHRLFSHKDEYRSLLPTSKLVQTCLKQLETSETFIPIGFPRLERRLLGVHRGELVLVAGRPGSGKSSLVTHFGLNAATRQFRCLFFSLAMPEEQLVARMLANLSGLNPARHIHEVHQDTASEAKEALNRASGTLSELSIFIDDTPGLSPEQVRDRAIAFSTDRGKVDMVIVDHFQLMEISDLPSLSMKPLKKLAKELRTVVFLVYELDHGVEQRLDKRPVLVDLRGSDSLPDTILFAYRYELYDPETMYRGIVEVICAKNSHGRLGEVEPLYFVVDVARFMELEEDKTVVKE